MLYRCVPSQKQRPVITGYQKTSQGTAWSEEMRVYLSQCRAVFRVSLAYE